MTPPSGVLRAACAAAWLAATAGCGSSHDSPPASNPVVFAAAEGGIHGHPMWDSWYDLGELGYVEEEFFVSGVARNAAGEPADYTTRILVRRPASAAGFSGTVLLDWVNVTAQFENAVDTLESHPFLHREGWAYVHVSAQAAGLCCTPLTPQAWDPVRYLPIVHPGDDWSFDMFRQVARGLRRPQGGDPLGGLKAAKIIAAGQSQSASRLYSYVDLGFADDRAIDAILIHAGGAKTFSRPVPVPVIHLLSDREADPAEPTADPNYALWEIAGAAHQDFWVGYHQEAGQGPRVLLDAPQQPAAADEELHAVAGNYGEQLHPLLGACVAAGAAFPMRYAVNAALFHLDRWARTGTRPPAGARYAFDGEALAVDEFGNTLGGIRLPPIDVPVARYQSTTCNLGGVTIPFTDLELAMLYPTHTDYVCAMQAASDASVAAGFLLPEDGAELMQRARDASNRWLEAGDGVC